MKPYFTIVDRKEVFGEDDKGTATVVRLITNNPTVIEELKPADISSNEEKQIWAELKSNIEKNTKFIKCGKEGYFEFDSELSENEVKFKLEAIGLHEYD